MLARFPHLLCVLILLGGCNARPGLLGDDADPWPATTDRAQYTGTGPNGPNSRQEVIVSGSNFKARGVTVADCQTRAHDDAWANAKEIRSASGLSWHVVVDHAASYDPVEIRVRGADGQWSKPAEIKVE